MTELSLTIFILIVPGILGFIIIDNLIIHEKRDSFFFVLFSIIIGLFSYCLLQLLMWCIDVLKSYICNTCFQHRFLTIWKILGLDPTARIVPWEIIWATVISIPLGFMVTCLIQHKVIYKVARRLNVSSKYGDENLFYYYLNSVEVDWVYIRDKENSIIYEGRIQSYSENEMIQEVVLTEVSAYDYYDPQDKIYETPSIYICREWGNLQIEQVPIDKFSPGGENERTSVN
ncbi:MAG: hypothetical protein WC329_03650 [Candidatus Omnitrophota bacterium]|jgi:hypothetical protein